jgi:hypothetical protein
MPPRLVCVGILLLWAVAAVALIQRDILPDLLIGTPPDLRSISRSEASKGLTRWAILVADDVDEANLRSVGQATTNSILEPNGWFRMSSEVWFDSGDLLRGTPFETVGNEHIIVLSAAEIDPSGNLDSFRAEVKLGSREGKADRHGETLLTLEGKVHDKKLEVGAKGPLPILNWSRSFPYQPRGMVQNTLGPMDHMPGLQVGQRWESRVISPLTGRVEKVRVEVARAMFINWGNNPVRTLEVITHLAPLLVKTWVRPEDGLVLRQEVPFPFRKLILERLTP